MKSYFSRRFPKIPYTAFVALSPISWCILCTALAYFLILSRANFEVTGTRMVFAVTCPIYMVIAATLSVIKYGGFDFFKTEERKEKLRVINKNIKNKHVVSSVSTKALKEMFYSLTELPTDGAATAVRYGGLVIVLASLTEWLVSEQMINLPIIVISSSVAMALLMLFVAFFAQRYIFPVLRECRALLAERGESIEEPQIRFNNLKTKFRFFLLIPILIVLVILSFISGIDLDVIILSLIGLIMAIMVSQQLSSSIYEAFAGIKDFARDLPTKQRTRFFTGSLDTEIVDLSESINRAADEVYISRKKVEKSERELKKRLVELERWYRLTAGRELRMAELKKEVGELKRAKKVRSI